MFTRLWNITLSAIPKNWSGIEAWESPKGIFPYILAWSSHDEICEGVREDRERRWRSTGRPLMASLSWWDLWGNMEIHEKLLWWWSFHDGIFEGRRRSMGRSLMGSLSWWDSWGKMEIHEKTHDDDPLTIGFLGEDEIRDNTRDSEPLTMGFVREVKDPQNSSWWQSSHDEICAGKHRSKESPCDDERLVIEIVMEDRDPWKGPLQYQLRTEDGEMR